MKKLLLIAIITVIGLNCMAFNQFSIEDWKSNKAGVDELLKVTENRLPKEIETMKVIQYMFTVDNVSMEDLLSKFDKNYVVAAGYYGHLANGGEESIYAKATYVMTEVFKNAKNFADSEFFVDYVILDKGYYKNDLKPYMSMTDAEVFAIVAERLVTLCDDALNEEKEKWVKQYAILLNAKAKSFKRLALACTKDDIKPYIEKLDMMAYQLLATSEDFKPFAVTIRIIKNSVN